MMFYRVDQRVFSVGDHIEPNTSFETELQGEKREMEELLNQTRPKNVPERNQCLFLFHDFICALRFFSKYGGFIYGVSIQNGTLIHFRGDMNKLDNLLDLFRFTEDEDLRTAGANEYWKDGTHTFNPCYELLVQSAQVEKIICDTTMLPQLRNEINQMGGSVEHTSMYRSLMQTIE